VCKPDVGVKAVEPAQLIPAPAVGAALQSSWLSCVVLSLNRNTMFSTNALELGRVHALSSTLLPSGTMTGLAKPVMSTSVVIVF